MQFEGQTAIVTGASRGIGRAVALELARQGCGIAFNFQHNQEAADELVAEIEAMGRKVEAFQVDVSLTEPVAAMVRKVQSDFGGVDFLVNNAGIIRDQLLLRMSEADWDAVLDTNLKGAYNFSKSVVAIMVRKRSGSILNITSVSGLVGMAGQVNYSASKAGMIGMTKALAKEVASRNITVNALALGMIATDMTGSLQEAHRKEMLERIPLRRFGEAPEIARIAAFLLSPEAGYITGQVIQADGGLAM